MEILDFEKQHNLELTVCERDPEAKDLPRYHASFDDAEIKVGIGLLGEYGDGNTPEEAIKDYCKKISNKTLIIDAMSSTNRREIDVPELQQTKDLRPTEESPETEKLRDMLRQIAEYEAAFQADKRLMEILERLASQVENKPPFIHLTGV